MTSEDAIRAELVGLLRYANATAVGEALGVSAQAVLNWADGKHPSQTRLDQVRRLYGLPVTSGDAEKRPGQSFDWAGLMERVDAIAEAVGAKTPEERLLDRVDDGTALEPDDGAARVGGGGQVRAPGQ